jgi:hypothetical protein
MPEAKKLEDIIKELIEDLKKEVEAIGINKTKV